MEAHHFLITLVKWLIQSSEVDNESLITIYPFSYTSINTASPVKRQKNLFLMKMVQGLNQRSSNKTKVYTYEGYKVRTKDLKCSNPSDIFSVVRLTEVLMYSYEGYMV